MKKNIKKIISSIAIFMLSILMLTGCDNQKGKQEQLDRLKRAQEKQRMNAPLTKSEKRELDGFNEWKKEYDAKEYNKKHYKKGY